jgi:hypothetical protein
LIQKNEDWNGIFTKLRGLAVRFWDLIELQNFLELKSLCARSLVLWTSTKVGIHRVAAQSAQLTGVGHPPVHAS